MRLLLLNQTFHPDVASTAQHAGDLASALVLAGHSVTVMASSRAYDDASVRYSRRETWRGVRIERVPGLGLGRKGRLRRILEVLFFLGNCAMRLSFRRRWDALITMTSPPFVFILAALFARLFGRPLVFWVMDLNPDQAVAAGLLAERSVVWRILEAGLRFCLRTSARVVALDRFMAGRLTAKGIPAEKISVVPPWSHDDMVGYDAEGRRRFRERYGLGDKFVVMYSGNHSPCHRLDALVLAAEALKQDPSIAFCFVGGGADYQRLRRMAERNRLANVLFLPYQPLEDLAASLSSADLQVVALGEPFVGIVHPCKIYNILHVGVPVLYVGPEQSHIWDLFQDGAGQEWAYRARNGDTGQVVAAIRDARRRQGRGLPVKPARQLAAQFSQNLLIPQMIGVIGSLEHRRPDFRQKHLNPESPRGIL